MSLCKWVIHFVVGLWLPARLHPGLLLQPAWGRCGTGGQKEGGCVNLHQHLTACQSHMHSFLLFCFNSPSSSIIHALPLSSPLLRSPRSDYKMVAVLLRNSHSPSKQMLPLFLTITCPLSLPTHHPGPHLGYATDTFKCCPFSHLKYVCN